MGAAFHGGQFWSENSLVLSGGHSCRDVINADVLDAWFGPAPELIQALRSEMDWVSRTSPPTHSREVELAIAVARGLNPESVLLGPGSSALMFLAWSRWFDSGFKALVVEPTYGEYAHLASHVIGGSLHPFLTSVEDGFKIEASSWLSAVSSVEPDVAVLVNPNNPTGVGCDIEALVDEIPSETLLWVDEAYIDYTSLRSAEASACSRRNVVVLKSLSKGFGLSGLRAAYLVGHPEVVSSLRKWVPPWWVSLPAQIAATMTWDHLPYYQARYCETRELRSALCERLLELPLRVVADEANWVLLQLEAELSAQAVVDAAAREKVFLRNAGATAVSLGDSFVRIAVKPLLEQERIVEVLRGVLAG